MFTAKKSAIGTHCVDLTPYLLGGILYASKAHNTGAVKKNIETSNVGNDLVNERDPVCLTRDIQMLKASTGNFVGDSLSLFKVDVGENHPGPLFRKATGGCQPQP